MTVDKSNQELYAARKKYWAIKAGIVSTDDSYLTPAQGNLIASNGSDSANQAEYVTAYQSEDMSGGLTTYMTIAIALVAVGIVYLLVSKRRKGARR